MSKERSKSIRKRVQENDEEDVGNGDVDLRWSILLTVCQRRRGLVAEEETKLE